MVSTTLDPIFLGILCCNWFLSFLIYDCQFDTIQNLKSIVLLNLFDFKKDRKKINVIKVYNNSNNEVVYDSYVEPNNHSVENTTSEDDWNISKYHFSNHI